jgi:hypothetical protein
MRKTRVPYFDQAELEVDDLAEVGDMDADEEAGAAALRAFLALTSTDRLADTRHVYAYYQDFREAVGGEDLFDADISVPETPDAIWAHVQPTQIYLRAGQEDEHCYLVAMCECGWEVEHGLMMVWRDGTTLCKVGGHDGHITNTYAYDDASLADVVYPAIDRRYRTYVSH